MPRSLSLFCWLLLGFISCSIVSGRVQAEERPNVLFIAVDDLRPEIHNYGINKMVTPNFDRLAAQGVRFNRAYCNIAVCGASRASLMSGLRPTPKRFTSYLTRIDKDAPEVTSLPRLFKDQGYTTISNGKIYHHQNDDPMAWSEPAWRGKKSSLWWVMAENQPEPGSKKRGPAFEAAVELDENYPDAITCEKTIQDLKRLAKKEEPFFLACGFYRPHLPFVAPQKYWDLYPEDEVILPNNMYFPHDLSQAFQYRWGEMRSYRGIPAQGPVSEETARNLIRGYHACVSFIDAQLGRLLDELDQLGIADNTIVVLWGDHGWQLGEHGFWCKHTNFEVATRTPLYIAGPGIKGGRACEKLVEFVDIYPTLCELAKIDKPEHLQGKSMQVLLNDVNAEFKEAVYTRHGGGDAVRTSDFRYMEMRTKNGAGDYLGEGLFDLKNDPAENYDFSINPNFAETRENLKEMLKQHKASVE